MIEVTEKGILSLCKILDNLNKTCNTGLFKMIENFQPEFWTIPYFAYCFISITLNIIYKLQQF